MIIKVDTERRVFTLNDIGKTFIVDPINPLKKKHRGRICVLVGFLEDDKADTVTPCFGVRFVDTGRRGRVEFNDLGEPI